MSVTIKRKTNLGKCSYSWGYSLIWAIQVCAAPKDMVFLPLLVINNVTIVAILVMNRTEIFAVYLLLN